MFNKHVELYNIAATAFLGYYTYDSTLPDDALMIELYAEYVPDGVAEELHFVATFEYEELGDSLTMVIEEGDDPFPGIDYGVYVMAPAMG